MSSTAVPTSASAPNLSSPSESSSNRANPASIKRKLENAIHSLDEVVGPKLSPIGDLAPPAKKVRTGRSLYATLAKYGIRKEAKQDNNTKNELATLSKTAPHLAAILSRSASRLQSRPSFKVPPPTSSADPTAEYRPSSLASFLARLATFKLTTYANKPPHIDAVAAARCGWTNDGKDRLVCGLCNAAWVVAGKEGMARDAANVLVERQRVSLVQAHKDGCPWKTRQCDPSIYRIPLHAPLAMGRELKSRAQVLDSILSGVEIKHPLTSNHVYALVSTVSSIPLSAPSPFDDATTNSGTSTSTESPVESEPSEAALITALFGWAVLPPAPPAERLRTHSRASSVAPPSTPRRASSVQSLRESTPVAASFTPTIPTTQQKPRADTTLLHCAFCQRRIGLWAFVSTPPAINGNGDSAVEASESQAHKRPMQRRQLDVLREHRAYCPYVVRSTVVPTLPVPPLSSAAAAPSAGHRSSGEQEGAVEGWRAVLAVISRHGLARRQRLGRVASSLRVSGGADGHQAAEVQGEEGPEMDSVEAMVTGVKNRGGKELLKYVKGLLG